MKEEKEMKRIIEAELETACKNFNTALNRFFKKYPELEYWRDTFEFMYENNEDFFCDSLMGDGSKNNDWRYALHLDDDDDWFYLCVIERE